MDPQHQNDSVVINDSPLYLPIEDATLIQLLTPIEMNASKEWNAKSIEKRLDDNVKFWKGDQVDESKLDKRYQMAHVDNVVHQDLENQIKLASGKMPDIFVAPPDKQDYNMEAARDIEQWLRQRIDSSTIKRLVKNGLRSLNLKFLAIIKARWDYTKQDFVFELIDVKDVRFGEGAKIVEDGFTIDGADTVFHYIEEPTQVIIAKFPKQAEALKAEIGKVAGSDQMPARLRYTEIHFRWYDDKGRMSEGVCWRYGNLILDKMKSPYYDFDHPEINYFDRPRKPFILFTYLNLGDGIYEATTPFEQAVPINKIINKRRRQITEISDRAVSKMAFSAKFLTKEQATNISPSPNEGIFGGSIDDIRKGVMAIPAVAPNPALMQDLQDLRSRIDSIFATHGTTRGEGGSESGVSKQISREGDLVTADDIVDIVIERVVSEMASWGMQFARLFYDEDRKPVRVTNTEGETQFINLKRQTLETDIQLVVMANTNDKDARRADALQQLQGKITDPYTFYEDIDVQNPKERTKRLINFIQAQQQGDFTGYLKSIGVKLDDSRASQEDAMRDIELLQQGGQPAVSKMPDEGYVATFLAFVNSPEFSQLDPGIQQRIQIHVQQLKRAVQAENPDAQQPDPNNPQNAQQALQGAPGVQQQAPYQPQVDPTTAFNAAPGNPTIMALQAKAQGMQQPGPQGRMPQPRTSEGINL